VTDTEAQPTRDQTAPLVRVGERFAERYEIEALIGRGGMGMVFRAHDIELDETIALKLIDAAATSGSDEVVERFRREVRLARRVTHRNTARTYDLGEHQGWRFLTMEFIEGQSLAELLEARRVELPRVLDIGRQIAEGLHAAHAADVVHRDLKPANVLIEAGGRAVITDFGIARVAHANDDTLHTHGTPGTPAYMAPEQLAGERVGPASDVYALGLIIHELLTGELPYRRESAMETALARLHESPPDLEATHGVDTPLAALLALMLSHAPAERPKPDAVIAALLDYEQELRERVEAEGEDSIPTASRRLALAVLPFLHRGPPDTAYIGEVLGDELIDLLAMTKGLRVSASGATARYRERRERDPREIGAELGVDALVDGTVQVAGQRVRISARLLDGESGFQRWSERFEGTIADVFELQDKLGKRIAEALRVEVEHSIHRGDATPEAIEHYLRARQLARAWRFRGDEGALASFSRCLELAPGFKPALAGYAHACIRAAYLPRLRGDPNWDELAAESLDAALGWAPELAETHLAAARFATARGDYRGASKSLSLALNIAPTYAAAHEYLGHLQIEGGRPERGREHLEQALDLDPSLVFCRSALARYHALRGDLDAYAEQVARYLSADPRPTEIPVRLLEIRVACWSGQLDDARARAEQLTDLMGRETISYRFASLLWELDLDEAAFEQRLAAMLPTVPNPAFRDSMLRMAAEASAPRGFDEFALRQLQRLATATLVDLDWFERCPALDSLRDRASFRQLLIAARARADAVWWQR